jgi:hypothetical protein
MTYDWLLNAKIYKGLFLGMAIYTALALIRINFIKQNGRWLRVFSHEFTHVIFSILFFNRIKSFRVGGLFDDGGKVEFYGTPNFAISLAPYCFQLFTFVFLIIRLITDQTMSIVVDVFIGIAFLFHLTTFWKQARPFQSDIQRHGYIFSYTFIILINLIFIGMIFSVIKGGFNEFGEYFANGFNKLYDIIIGIINLFTDD